MSRMLRRLRRARVRAVELLETARPATAAVRGAFRRAGLRSDPDGHAVLLAPAGAGNIGDQAMIEAYLDRTPGEVRIVQRHDGDIRLREGDLARVRTVALDHLIYGTSTQRAADRARFIVLLDGARELAVVGADIMDGRYSLRSSVARAGLAEGAALAGVPARVLAFSWNAAPRRNARDAIRGAAAAGVRLLARDPLSAERLRRDLGARRTAVEEVSDLVFSAESIDPSVADELLAGVAVSSPIALVNASALVGRSLDQLALYAALIDRLRELGATVVLLPHVIRDDFDDLDAARRILDRVGDDRVLLVDRELTPDQVRGLVARARLTITGRMHLAIISIRAGVPAVTFATQGKVEGLMQLIGAPRLAIQPTAGAVDRVLPLVDELLASDDLHDAVDAARERLVELSDRNFTHPVTASSATRRQDPA